MLEESPMAILSVTTDAAAYMLITSQVNTGEYLLAKKERQEKFEQHIQQQHVLRPFESWCHHQRHHAPPFIYHYHPP